MWAHISKNTFHEMIHVPDEASSASVLPLAVCGKGFESLVSVAPGWKSKEKGVWPEKGTKKKKHEWRSAIYFIVL